MGYITSIGLQDFCEVTVVQSFSTFMKKYNASTLVLRIRYDLASFFQHSEKLRIKANLFPTVLAHFNQAFKT